MIKKILIASILFYKVFLSVFLNSIIGFKSSCRFEESCSAYATRVINENGSIKGLYMSIVRLLKCQPFYKQDSKGAIA